MRVGYRRDEPDGAERGCPALRPSPDPENRAYVKSLFQDIGFPAQGQKAHMLECPDFFPWMARAFCSARRKGLCLAAAICGISLKTAVSPGPKNLSFSPGPAFRELDAGHDFHAAQTLAAPDGVLERHLIRGRTRMGEEAA